jgi:hypothetical protein
VSGEGLLSQTAGLDDALLFDPQYYSALYSDLLAAFGGDATALRRHWLTYGIGEGRRASPIFDCGLYLAIYPDLRAAFGTDCAAAMNHFLNQGLPNEGRRASVEFDVTYYLGTYADLTAAFGARGFRQAAEHFLSHGLSQEGRAGSSEFNVTNYLCRYGDLVNAFHDNYRAAAEHWATNGLTREGRRGSAHFDVQTYLARYADLRAASGSNYAAAMQHWVSYGIHEGRSGDPNDGGGAATCNLGPQGECSDLTALGNQPHTPENLVKYAYCLMLRRPADAGGLQNYTARLSGRTLLPKPLLGAFYQSAEFQNANTVTSLSATDFVTLLYRRLLLREPDAGGVATQVGALEAGMSRVQLVRGFLDSDEFAARHPILFDDAVESALDSLWNGTAGLRIIANLSLPTHTTSGGMINGGMNMGTQIIPVGGVWYLFNREFFYMSPPAQCQQFGAVARIVARASSDQGRSWSDEVSVAEPNFAAGECLIADGHAYWDAETGTWHYMTQEIGGSGHWNGNHYTRQAASPLGPFVPDPGNPVIRGGDLWRRICGPGKACPAGSVDEGTFDIAYKEGGLFYVTFHGAYAVPGTSIIQGFRSIAKTADFHGWITSDWDLPGDAMWSARDCQGWNVPWAPSTGCIGGGASTSLQTYRRTYMLIESADLTLGIANGQRWADGLVRADRFVRSGAWEQYPKNALFEDGSTLPGTSVAYPAMFSDGGKVYFSYWTGNPNPYLTTFHVAELVAAPPAAQTAGTSARIETSFSILRAYARSCDPQNPVSTDCYSAISRYCAGLGYGAGGYGLEYNLDSLSVVCIANQGADAIGTSFSALKGLVPSCDASSPLRSDCAAAIGRFCAQRGYGGEGFGPLEHVGDSLIVSCLASSRADVSQTTFATLSGYHSQCTAAAPISAPCNSAIDQFCLARGYVGGYGALEHSGDQVIVACVGAR